MHLNLSFIPLLLWLEKKIFSFFGTLRMQQEARENAVARWIPPHSCVDLGLQPDFFALGDVDRQTSGSHLSQGREKPTERTLLECQISAGAGFVLQKAAGSQAQTCCLLLRWSQKSARIFWPRFICTHSRLSRDAWYTK